MPDLSNDEIRVLVQFLNGCEQSDIFYNVGKTARLGETKYVVRVLVGEMNIPGEPMEKLSEAIAACIAAVAKAGGVTSKLSGG